MVDKKKGDIPFWSFDPQIFHVGTPYSDLVPPSNFSIPIRVILGWDIPFWSFFLDIYSIVAPVMELFHSGPHRCRLSVVAGVLGGTQVGVTSPALLTADEYSHSLSGSIVD